MSRLPSDLLIPNLELRSKLYLAISPIPCLSRLHDPHPVLI